MGIGVELKENFKIYIGEEKQILVKNLDNYSVKYRILYDKINKDNEPETIVALSDIDTELYFVNNLLNKIKMINNTQTNIIEHNKEIVSPLDFIDKVKSKINNLCDSKNHSVKIERIDLNSMNCSFIVKTDNKKSRVSISRDTMGNVFLNTIRKLD